MTGKEMFFVVNAYILRKKSGSLIINCFCVIRRRNAVLLFKFTGKVMNACKT